jgi:hypothetical protein
VHRKKKNAGWKSAQTWCVSKQLESGQEHDNEGRHYSGKCWIGGVACDGAGAARACPACKNQEIPFYQPFESVASKNFDVPLLSGV